MTASRPRPRWYRTLGRTGAWLLLAVVMLRPTPHRITSTVAGDLGDPMFLTWTLSWGAHGLWNAPLEVFDANIFHPHGHMLALSDPMLSLAPVFGVLQVVTGNRITALNLLMIGLFMLALASAHALGRRILGRGDLAVVVAVVAACNGYVFGQQNHPQIQTFGFLPLAFLLLFRAVEHRRVRDGLALGAVTVALTLANLSFGAIWFVSALVALGVLWARNRLRPWRTLLRPAVPAALVTVVVLGPVGLVYRDAVETFSLRRGYEPEHSLLLTDAITPQRDNWLWGTALDGINSTGRAGEHGAFPGLLALALGLLGVVLFLRFWVRPRSRDEWPRSLPRARTDELAAVVVAALVALVLAVGPSPGGWPGPFRFFHAYVPGFEGIRATSRFIPIGLVGAGFLAAWAVSWLMTVVPRRFTTAVVPCVVLIILVEVWGPMSRVEVPDGEVFAVYEAIAEREPGAVLELPIQGPADGFAWPFVEAPRMYYATTDFNPRVNGYSGHAPPGFDAVATVLNGYPSPDARAALDDLDVRYVVLHTGSEQGYPALDEATAQQMASDARIHGDVVSRHGNDWLIELSAA